MRPSSAVTLAGGQAAWLTPLRDGGRALYQGRTKGRASRVQVFRKPSTPPGASRATYGGGAFAGSPSTIVLELAVIGFNTHISSANSWPSEFFLGPPGSPLASDGRCDFDPRSGLGRVAVSGDAVARVRCDEVAEVRDGAVVGPPFTAGAQVHGVRLAGRYLATLEGDYDYASPGSALDLVVYDRLARVEVYRLPSAEVPGLIRSLSVQDDGTVAFTYRATSARYQSVAWASVSDPAVHRVPLARRDSYGIQIGANRIAFSRDTKGSDTAGSELGIATLSGRTRLIATDIARSAFDFDGRHIAYVRRGCQRVKVVRRGIDGRTSTRRCRRSR